MLQLVNSGALPAVKIGKTLALHRTAVEVRAAETGRSTSDLIRELAGAPATRAQGPWTGRPCT